MLLCISNNFNCFCCIFLILFYMVLTSLLFLQNSTLQCLFIQQQQPPFGEMLLSPEIQNSTGELLVNSTYTWLLAPQLANLNFSTSALILLDSTEQIGTLWRQFRLLRTPSLAIKLFVGQ